MLSTLSSVCVLQAGELGRWVGFPNHNVEKTFVKSNVIILKLYSEKDKKFEEIFDATYKRSINFEISFWRLQIDQKSNEIFVRLSALASRKRIKKIPYLNHF